MRREILDVELLVGAGECWYVDLEADRIETYLSSGGSYPPPRVVYLGEPLEPAALPGFSMPATEALTLG